MRPGEVDSGRLAGLGRLVVNPFNLLGKYNDDETGNNTRRTRHVQRQHTHFGEFRVPGLRQVGRGGPYMHNGSVLTLEDVVKHYSEVSPDRLHSDGVPLVRRSDPLRGDNLPGDNLPGDNLLFALDGSVELEEQGELVLIDAAASWCGGPGPACAAGLTTIDLSFTLYLAADAEAEGGPLDRYEATVTGASNNSSTV